MLEYTSPAGDECRCILVKMALFNLGVALFELEIAFRLMVQEVQERVSLPLKLGWVTQRAVFKAQQPNFCIIRGNCKVCSIARPHTISHADGLLQGFAAPAPQVAGEI